MSQSLERALRELEAAVGVRSIVSVGGCSYCYSESDLEMIAGPVDKMTGDLLASVAAEVPDHWGDFPAVYRKFTPRILRSLAYDQLHVDEELIAHRLGQAGCWTTWPEIERSAVLAVLQAVLHENFATHPHQPSLDMALRMLSTTPEPFDRWLDQIDAVPPGTVELHLIDLCRAWLPQLGSGSLTFGWLDDITVSQETVDWLRGQYWKRLAPMGDELPEDVRRRMALL